LNGLKSLDVFSASLELEQADNKTRSGNR